MAGLPEGVNTVPEPMLTRDYWHPPQCNFKSQCNFTENVQDMLTEIIIQNEILKSFMCIPGYNELITRSH